MNVYCLNNYQNVYFISAQAAAMASSASSSLAGGKWRS